MTTPQQALEAASRAFDEAVREYAAGFDGDEYTCDDESRALVLHGVNGAFCDDGILKALGEWLRVGGLPQVVSALSALPPDNAAQEEPILPCDVTVAPATVFKAGVKLSTLLKCIERRRTEPPPSAPAGDEEDQALCEMLENPPVEITWTGQSGLMMRGARAIRELNLELEVLTEAQEKMARILSRIVIAVRGPEQPLHSHGWADLEERIRSLTAELARMGAKWTRSEAAWQGCCIQREDSWRELEIIVADRDRWKAAAEACDKILKCIVKSIASLLPGEDVGEARRLTEAASRGDANPEQPP